MKPTQNNRPQRAWRARLTREEAHELALLEWQIGVNDVYRTDLAHRRQRLVNRASARAPSLGKDAT